MADFESAWEQCQKDENGNLNPDEFKILLIQLNILKTDEQSMYLFIGSDLDKERGLSKDETKKLIDILQSDDKTELNKIFFRAIDRDKNGLINQYEFPQLLRANDMHIPKHELRYLFKKMTKGDNFARFDQCLSFILKKDVPPTVRPYPDDYEVPPEIAKFNKIFDEIDTQHIESLNFDQFKEFIYTYLERYDLTETEVEAWYNGTNYDHVDRVPKIDIMDLIMTLQHHPKETLVYLYFRGCDDNRDCRLSLPAYRDFLLLNKYEITPEEKAYLKSGKDDTIDFPTAYMKIMGKEPREADPYERMSKFGGTYREFNALWEKLDSAKRGYLSFDEFKEFLMTEVNDCMTE